MYVKRYDDRMENWVGQSAEERKNWPGKLQSCVVARDSYTTPSRMTRQDVDTLTDGLRERQNCVKEVKEWYSLTLFCF